MSEAEAPPPSEVTEPVQPAEPLAPPVKADGVPALGRLVLALLAVLVVLTIFVMRVRPRLEPEDLAKGKPWRASSKLADCSPETLTCGNGRTAIFYHTVDEESPWVEFDLGAPTTFSSVLVQNRRDGSKDILDRSVPLVLEVSDERVNWKVIDRIDGSFSVWNPHFESVTARFVRFKTPRRTMQHLESVKIYR